MDLSFWRNRRVLVTGHTGFKGAWLALLLGRLGARVTGYALAPPTNPSLHALAGVDSTIDANIADLRDAERIAAVVTATAPEVVLHLAARSVVLESYVAPVDTYSTNVMGTVHLLDALRRTATRAVVVNVTTDKVYRNAGWPWGYRESDPLGGRDPYSSSKACAELVAQSFRDSFFPITRLAEHGVALASARAGNVIGGGDWTPHQLVPAIVAAFDAGEPVALRHPGATRPWQHVLDCLAGYLRLAEALAADPAAASSEWNFGPAPADTWTVAQVAEALATHWQVETTWTQAPGTPHHEEHELRLDASKATRLLGWCPRLDTRAALDWTARWYRDVRLGVTARRACERQIDTWLATPPLRAP